jgi:hypothetical protein
VIGVRLEARWSGHLLLTVLTAGARRDTPAVRVRGSGGKVPAPASGSASGGLEAIGPVIAGMLARRPSERRRGVGRSRSR